MNYYLLYAFITLYPIIGFILYIIYRKQLLPKLGKEYDFGDEKIQYLTKIHVNSLIRNQKIVLVFLLLTIFITFLSTIFFIIYKQLINKELSWGQLITTWIFRSILTPSNFGFRSDFSVAET